MNSKSIRTDLAYEASLAHSAEGLVGVELTEEEICGLKLTSVEINDQKAADILCKPIGKYLTLELKNYADRRDDSFSAYANALSRTLKRFEAVKNSRSFLIACLGNRSITPDAVGPKVADGLIVTRHLKNSLPDTFELFSSVACIRTGVLGTTGIESASAVAAVCDRIKPDCVIAVDALASAELDRLCRNIQICDSGIAPGSGVGNDREPISRDTLGVPVIAVGVPTVIDASAFSELEEAKGLFVTPRNIDELVHSVSKLIAYGINLAVHPQLTVSDIDSLRCFT